MNKIEKIARKCYAVVEFDCGGDATVDSLHELQNNIFSEACSEFGYRLPPARLYGSDNSDFKEDAIGDWGGREFNAGCAMQTVYERAIELASAERTAA